MTYRPEIDGLRAISVLAVILYHAGAGWLSGGFVGVDVFFVISGFLITSIIAQSLEQKQFSYLSFYARRAKRLLPAAITLLLATVVFGALILSPEKYYELAKSAVYANLFMANIWFMEHSGYFDTSTQISPLVHMWSLAVEEQFYFIYPFVLVLAYKLAKFKGLLWTIVAIIISSFSLNLLLINDKPNFTFYMLPTRAWELGLGALVYFLPQLKSDKLNMLLSILGISAIVYALLAITQHNAYPGFLALIPTLAAAALIYSLHGSKNIVKIALASKPMVLIGKTSYSAYLWHWPIIVYYRIYINERAFNAAEVLALIIVSMLAGYLSWKYIENRYRYRDIKTGKLLKIAGYATLGSVLMISSVLATRGFGIRVSDELAAISNNKLMRSLPCVENIRPFEQIDEQFCVIGVPWQEAKQKGVVWGDSHSLHWGQVLHQQAKRLGLSLVIAPRNCPAYLNSEYIRSHYPKYPNFSEDCSFRNQQTLRWLKKNNDVDLVILASAWSGQLRMHYTEQQTQNKTNTSLYERRPEVGAALAQVAFTRLLSELKTKKVLVIADIPRPNKNLNECAFAESTILLRSRCTEDKYKYLKASEVRAWHSYSDELIQQVATEHNNVTAIIPSELLCQADKCRTYINGELIYRDDNHIRSNLQESTANILAEKLHIARFIEAYVANEALSSLDEANVYLSK